MTYMDVCLPINMKWREVPDKCYYFDKLSKKELTAYYEWFQAAIPERIDQLTEAVRGTAACESWTPDFTPESLLTLGAWFAGQVKVSKLTYEEKHKLRAQMVAHVAVPQTGLTERTFSIAFDVGIYFGEVIRRNVPGAKWTQRLGSRKNVDFGQAVLVGHGKVPLEPTRIAEVLANEFVGREEPVTALRDVYDIWARMLSGDP